MSTDIEERLDEIRGRGLYRRLRCVSGPQGPRVLLDGRPVLLLCSNNYLGLADHPRVREAAAEAAMRYGAGSGASRLVSGNMTIHRRLEEALCDFKGAEACLLFGSGFLANAGVVSALAREGDVVFSDALNHASIIDGCRLSRAETFVYDHCDIDHLEWGLRQAEGRGALIVTDGVFSMDGDVAPLREDRRPGPALRRARDGGRGARHGLRRSRRPRPGGRARARGRGGRDRGHAGQGARLLRRLRLCGSTDGEVPDQHRAHADLLHRPATPGGRGRDGRARAAARAAAPGGEAAAQRARAAGGAGRGGPAGRRRTHADRAADRGRRGRRGGGERARARARDLRPGDPARRRCRRARRGCAWR